jgi:hypothetical protein
MFTAQCIVWNELQRLAHARVMDAAVAATRLLGNCMALYQLHLRKLDVKYNALGVSRSHSRDLGRSRVVVHKDAVTTSKNIRKLAPTDLIRAADRRLCCHVCTTSGDTARVQNEIVMRLKEAEGWRANTRPYSRPKGSLSRHRQEEPSLRRWTQQQPEGTAHVGVAVDRFIWCGAVGGGALQLSLK